MDKFVVVIDVSCDMSEELYRFAGIDANTIGHIHISDGRDIPAMLDWSQISREEFYKILSNKRLEVSSAPAGPEETYEFFKGFVKDGYQVLCLCISSKISSTYGVCKKAADRVMQEYENSRVECIDTGKMSGAHALLALYAGLMKKEGKSLDKIKEWVENNKTRVHQMGPIDDLLFIARRGRITMGKAIMGNFAGVKPMGECNTDGYVTVLTKVKGIGRALEATAKYYEKTAVDIENNYLIIAHSDREQYAQRLKELILERCAPKKIFITDVFSASGTNIGPGMVGIYYLGEHTSENLEREKNILLQITGKA